MESNPVHRENVNTVDTQLTDQSHPTQDLGFHKFKAKLIQLLPGERYRMIWEAALFIVEQGTWNESSNGWLCPVTKQWITMLSSSWYLPMTSRWRDNSLHRMSGTLKGVYRKVTDIESCTYEARLPKHNGPAQVLSLLARLKHATPLTTLHSTDITLSHSTIKSQNNLVSTTWSKKLERGSSYNGNRIVF